MATKTMSKRKINELVNKCPSPVLQHLKRCKKLAEFVLEKAKVTDWYVDLDLNDKEVASAIFYHDFGKAFIPSDFVHLRHCKNKKERAEYYTHTQKGCDYIEENSQKYTATGKVFDRYLYDVVKYHHENCDGTGLLGLTKDDIPFVARLCAVIDAFDNILAVGSVRETAFEDAYQHVVANADTLFDRNVCEVLVGDKELIKDFCDDLFASDKRTRQTKYGIAMRYIPHYTIASHDIVGLEAQLVIRDPYFGIVSPSIFLPIASRNESIVALNRILRYRTLRQAELFVRHNVDFGRIRIVESLRSLNKKNYLSELSKLLKAYGVPAHLITIAIPEDFLLGVNDYMLKLVNDLHELGVRISVERFGERNSSFVLFDKVHIDEISISPKLIASMMNSTTTYKIVNGLVALARDLGVEVVCGDVESNQMERALNSMGVNFVYGSYFGEPLTAYAVEKMFNIESKEDDD